MVIDDEEFCISAMRALLGIMKIDTKYHVDFCINGEEAVNKVKESYSAGMTYKLILTDFKMPIMDGIDATKSIRKYLT